MSKGLVGGIATGIIIIGIIVGGVICTKRFRRVMLESFTT